MYLALILALALLWAVLSAPKPLGMFLAVLRSIFLALAVAIVLFELGWIPLVRRYYFDHDYPVLRFGYFVSMLAFGLSMGLHRDAEPGKKQRFVIALFGPLAALPLLIPAVIMLSRWNVPRSYGADLTDLIGAMEVLMPGPIPALLGCGAGLFLSAKAARRRTARA